MKLLQDAAGAHHIVTGYGPDHVAIDKTEYRESLVVLPDALISPWADSIESLAPTDFAAIIEARPALVLLGTGPRQRYPDPAILRPLIEAGIGFEVMDLAAACRTYNILVGEGRRAAAALMLR